MGLSREGRDEWLSRRAGGRGGDAPEAWLLQGRGFEDKSPCRCAAGFLGGCGIELIPRAGGVCLSPRPTRGDSSHGQGQRCTPRCSEASSGAQTHGNSPERAAGSQGIRLRADVQAVALLPMVCGKPFRNTATANAATLPLWATTAGGKLTGVALGRATTAPKQHIRHRVRREKQRFSVGGQVLGVSGILLCFISVICSFCNPKKLCLLFLRNPLSQVPGCVSEPQPLLPHAGALGVRRCPPRPGERLALASVVGCGASGACAARPVALCPLWSLYPWPRGPWRGLVCS